MLHRGWPAEVLGTMTRALPARTEIGPDTPLRLDVAAAQAFPDGTMTASGLRREAGRGRLVIERVAGKDYTTLAHIDRMRELCRLAAKVPDCGCAASAVVQMVQSAMEPPGSSRTADTSAALAAARSSLPADPDFRWIDDFVADVYELEVRYGHR
jgi:hypothetical protein